MCESSVYYICYLAKSIVRQTINVLAAFLSSLASFKLLLLVSKYYLDNSLEMLGFLWVSKFVGVDTMTLKFFPIPNF